jgi:hypothetical protein
MRVLLYFELGTLCFAFLGLLISLRQSLLLSTKYQAQSTKHKVPSTKYSYGLPNRS